MADSDSDFEDVDDDENMEEQKVPEEKVSIKKKSKVDLQSEQIKEL